ncbi:rRNA maturation RNase YbeY [Epilithonimonas bovis DSM 19482]|uniref:Endoribonuclease YbeY n=1 Tax=Epilithonimonas bovis DSM 19482 TaxID=1121284 RepID=A0A1U7PVI0_9FLAO|nr:rRNA maturation RNase YbeY [Epilithonimonas bovis]QIY84470.1 rRNA maturation RNase YbeY [Chryseobacterium sp. NEB161]SIT96707.1 rRNA maturation RNase YbeY [Epilithonimonas bovis DSM 19482]HBR11320.1 rRNA maturation RNase YbeY [Chryseobacterium sp.]
MINYFFENIDTRNIHPDITAWLENLIITEDKKPGDISYIFCDDDYLLKVNQDYLDHDYYTDVITFDYVKGKTISGDIFVSLPRILENADLLSQDFEREFRRVLAHGVLHLCGYKDKSEADAREMREKEEFYLAKFSDFQM